MVDPGYGETMTEGWRALELFTDRVAARMRFCSYLNDDPSPSSVLVFHGDGGNGKSLLLLHLREHLCKRIAPDNWEYLKGLGDEECLIQVANAADATPVPFGRLDFGEGSMEGYDALLELRRDLSAPGLRFPLFDFGIVTYLQKSRQLTPEHLRSVFPADDLDFILELVKLSTDVPVAGLFIKFVALLDRRFGSPFQVFLEQRGLTEGQILAIRRMDHKAELLRALPQLFAQDINTALADPAGPARIVFFFDTHENFWGHERNIEGDRYFGRDEWLRRLVRSLNRSGGAVVVVAGREAPKWDVATRAPVTDLERIPIGDLTDADARSYLDRAGITDVALRTQLLADARVGPDQIHPYYLGLGADLALVAEEEEEPLAETDLELAHGPASQERKLVDRLLRYVDSGLRDAVSAVSAGRSFDWDVFNYLGGELDFPREQATFRMLTAFSFVRRIDEGSGRYRIHDLLRRLTLDEDRERIRQKAHVALEIYFRARADQGDDRARAEAIYHTNRLDWERGVDEWVTTFVGALRQSRFDRCRALLGVRNELIVQTPGWAGRVTIAEGEYFTTLSRYPEARAEHIEAIAAYDRALALAPDVPEVHNSRGIALQRLGALQAQLSRSSDAERSYRDSIAAFDHALTLAPDDPSIHNNLGEALQSLGDLQAQLSQNDTAGESYRESIAAYDRALVLAPDDPVIYSNLGDALQRLGALQAQLSQNDTAEESYRESIAAYDRALVLAPDSVNALTGRGRARVVLSKRLLISTDGWDREVTGSSLRAALADLEHLLRLAPNDQAASVQYKLVREWLAELGEDVD
ncbi:MAG: tetratricopeptide repeat protein [Thermomicrobiales bacterium]